MDRRKIKRRSFLKATPALFFGMRAICRGQVPTERGRLSEEDVPLIRERLLNLVNQERAEAGLSQLKLDELACRVATEHARDMATRGFFNHLGSDGRTPFHRYASAGGTEGLQENVSAADDIESLSPLRVMNDLKDMHESMIKEKPPNDGHRKTILFPFHTHVGFGVAIDGRHVRLDELYLARYVQFDPFVKESKPKSTVVLSGQLISPARFLNNVDVCFERLPEPRSLEWLRANANPLPLPDVIYTLRPKVPEGLTYPDGATGDFEWSRSGKFRVPVKLKKSEPGVYSVIFWVRRVPSDKGFTGAQVCIWSR